MSLDFWVDALSVGVDEFDRDHRHQLNTLGEIEELLGQGNRAEAQVKLEQLLLHVAAHQVRELALLEQGGYPDIDRLQAAQASDLLRLRSMSERVESGIPFADARDLVRNMRMGFADCLLKGDINFRPYMEAADLRRR
jgi:hemerythrin